jgi:hypothetical protein
MVCKVKMGSYPNFTDGVQWTISGNGDHGMEHDNAVESWEITGCENSSVVFYEHGDHNQRQQAHVLTNGKYQIYNAAQWINSHGPYAGPLSGISAAKIQSPGGESLTNGGKINAIIDIPDGQGPRAQESSTVDNWDNYLKPNQDHGLSEHCPGATWKAWQHAKTADKPAKALCQWKITENNMASLAASNETHVKGKYNTIINRVCNAIKNDKPDFKTGRANNETCWDLVSTQDFMKDYCFKENRMSDNPLCSKSSLGDSYDILATEYCVANPDKEFCKCYNVVNYETVCANRPTSVGCALAKTKLDSIEEKLGVKNATDSLPCGTLCSGANNYLPPGYKSGCDITYNACIMSIDIGESNAEVNAACNIDSTSGITDGETGGSDGSGGSGSVPLSTTQTSDLEKTVAEMKKQKEEEDEEAKKTNKKLLIGGGGGGILSSISCLILLVIIVMVMSKKGGGGRRR